MLGVGREQTAGWRWMLVSEGRGWICSEIQGSIGTELGTGVWPSDSSSQSVCEVGQMGFFG